MIIMNEEYMFFTNISFVMVAHPMWHSVTADEGTQRNVTTKNHPTRTTTMMTTTTTTIARSRSSPQTASPVISSSHRPLPHPPDYLYY